MTRKVLTGRHIEAKEVSSLSFKRKDISYLILMILVIL